MSHHTIIPLDSLGALVFHGRDGRAFLQGQLSNDLAMLDSNQPLLAGLHNPQGRCLALLQLIQADHSLIVAVLPAELQRAIADHLRRYVLRSQVQIALDDGAWRAWGLIDARGTQMRVLPSDAPAPDGSVASEEVWQAARIAAGIPQVYSATSGAFVAQMLNLDRIGAISFTKGCYPGQEIIARARYRGQVKRRLQRFFCPAGQPLAPGETRRLPDGRRIQIVMAATVPNGQEFLGVVPLAASAQAESGSADTDEAPVLAGARQLELPYQMDSGSAAT